MTAAADANKLTPEERRRHENAVRNRDTIRQFLNGDPKAKPPRPPLDDDAIATLIRRSRYDANDAYTVGGAGRGNDVSNRTLAAVIRDAGGRVDELTGKGTPDLWREAHDPVREAMLDILGALAEAAGVLELAKKRREYVDGITDKAFGRVNTVELCAECGEPAPKVHRIDGQPYCATTCYQRVNRRRRGQPETETGDNAITDAATC